MIFHKTNDISLKFSGMTLCFYEVLKYFVDFHFCFQYYQKMTLKFQFHSYRFEILKFRTWQWPKFKKSILQLPTLYQALFNASVVETNPF
jgi:hypothetical protein